MAEPVHATTAAQSPTAPSLTERPFLIRPPAWGQPWWSLNAFLAFKLDEAVAGGRLDGSEAVRLFEAFMQSEASVLPCGLCVGHARRYLTEHPVETPLLQWVHRFHGAVRARQGKEPLPNNPSVWARSLRPCVVWMAWLPSLEAHLANASYDRLAWAAHILATQDAWGAAGIEPQVFPGASVNCSSGAEETYKPEDWITWIQGNWKGNEAGFGVPPRHPVGSEEVYMPSYLQEVTGDWKTPPLETGDPQWPAWKIAVVAVAGILVLAGIVVGAVMWQRAQQQERRALRAMAHHL